MDDAHAVGRWSIVDCRRRRYSRRVDTGELGKQLSIERDKPSASVARGGGNRDFGVYLVDLAASDTHGKCT